MVSGDGTILSSPFVLNGVLPFLLVFSVVFAILQKSKILGDNKRQIDAIVAAVVGLIVISFGYATGIIVSLVPFLAVSVVILLVFMILFAFLFQGTDNDKFVLPDWLKNSFTGVILIALIVVVLVATGAWEYLAGYVMAGDSSALFANAVFIIVIIAAVVAVAWGGKSGSTEKGKDK